MDLNVITHPDGVERVLLGRTVEAGVVGLLAGVDDPDLEILAFKSEISAWRARFLVSAACIVVERKSVAISASFQIEFHSTSYLQLAGGLLQAPTQGSQLALCRGVRAGCI